MKFNPPLLTEGPLSGRVYVVTHGKLLDSERGHVRATVKFDVTEQFEALVAKRIASGNGTAIQALPPDA